MKIMDQTKTKSNPPIRSENIAAGMVFRECSTKDLFLKTTNGIVDLQTFHYLPDHTAIVFCDEHLDVELVIKGVLPAGG